MEDQNVLVLSSVRCTQLESSWCMRPISTSWSDVPPITFLGSRNKPVGETAVHVLLSFRWTRYSQTMILYFSRCCVSRLTNLGLPDNELSGKRPGLQLGCLLELLGSLAPPRFLSLCVTIRIRVLVLYENVPPASLAILIAGTLPKELGNLTALVGLWLAKNRLEGRRH